MRFPISHNTTLRHALEEARAYAKTEYPIVINGETGAGKEFLAKAIHDSGPRRNEPFVAVNLAAFAEGVLESELFGHIRGAFTDAKTNRKGCLERAGKGTIFLDEFHLYKPHVKDLLLRLLDIRTYTPVGGEKEKVFEGRFLFGMNRHPLALMMEGLISPDIYYRISTFVIGIPPLRQRREDILPLVRYFIEQAGYENVILAEEDYDFLMSYGFPGNVRQLKTLVEHALTMKEGNSISLKAAKERIETLPSWELPVIQNTNIQQVFETPSQGCTAKSCWKCFVESNTGFHTFRERQERMLLEEAMKECGGNMAKVARLLRITYTTLHSKMKHHGIGSESRKKYEKSNMYTRN